jgi:hypothetical protein
LIDPLSEWLKIELLQRTSWAKLAAIVPHQQLTVYQKDVRLHAAKAVVQSVKQRPLMTIVVMGVGPNKWYDGTLLFPGRLRHHCEHCDESASSWASSWHFGVSPIMTST